MLSLYILFPLNVEICVSSLWLLAPWIFGGYAVGELSEGYLPVRVHVHPSDDRVDIALAHFLLKLGEELPDGFEIQVAMSLLVDHSEGSHGAEVHLSLQGLLLALDLQVVVHLSI